MENDAESLRKAVEIAARNFRKDVLSNKSGGFYFDLDAFKVEFSFSERWGSDISCVFVFGEGVTFFFEDVRDVVDKRGGDDRGTNGLEFVGMVSEFIVRNFDFLTQHVLEWFQPAAEVAYRRCKVHFPELAEIEYNNAMIFLSFCERFSAKD